jgi:hypothetical protein
MGPPNAEDDPGHRCVVCGSDLTDPDPTAQDLQTAIQQLQEQLVDVEASRPRREALLADLHGRADDVRGQLRACEAALSGLAATHEAADNLRLRVEEQAFTKGRIDQYLTSITAADDEALVSCWFKSFVVRVGVGHAYSNCCCYRVD